MEQIYIPCAIAINKVMINDTISTITTVPSFFLFISASSEKYIKLKIYKHRT